MIRTFTPKKLILSSCIAALALLGASPTIAEDAAEDMAEEMTKGEAELAELLEGRIAGEPRDCISDFRGTHMKTINDTAYVYGRGNTIYVQRTRDPGDIDDDDVLVIRKHGSSRLCRLDYITTVDRYSGFFSGSVRFEQFVPYTRVDDDQG